MKTKECESPSNFSIHPDVQKLPNIISVNIDNSKLNNGPNMASCIFQNESIKSVEKKAVRLKNHLLESIRYTQWKLQIFGLPLILYFVLLLNLLQNLGWK